MAEVHKPILVGNTWTNIIDPATGESANFEQTTTWYDGSPMDDGKVDGVIYIKIKGDYGGGYGVRVLGTYGQVLQKDTMSDLRNLSDTEILLLKMGYYKGVQLNGFYKIGDLPNPIVYTYSTSLLTPNGGNIISVINGGYLVYEFKKTIHTSYFGSIGDNTTKTVQFLIDQNIYLDLADVQVSYPHVDSLTNSIDWVALQAAINVAGTSVLSVELGYGRFILNKTLQLNVGRITLVGCENGGDQTGTPFSSCQIIWRGGAEPMFKASATKFYFKDFGVTNEGEATEWLYLDAGAQSNIYERLHFVAGTGHVPFSNAVIYSNGQRVGYSQFRNLNIVAPSSVFLFVESDGTGNSNTPITFSERCIIRSASTPTTLVKLKATTIESITIRDCTIIQNNAQMLILDTSESPNATTVPVFVFESNEIDSTPPSSDQTDFRYFKLTNVSNARFTGNHVYAGGTKAFVADLVNSNVTFYDSNHFNGVAPTGAFFNADDSSTVIVGKNTGNNAPSVINLKSTVTFLDWSTGQVWIDGRKLSPDKVSILNLDVTTNASQQIRIDTSRPEFMIAGQVFTIIIRNVSGSTIATPNFFGVFDLQGTAVAPENGFSRMYTFYWDGTRAKELYRSTADIPNTV